MFDWLFEKFRRRKMLHSETDKLKKEQLKKYFKDEDKQNRELREKRPFFLKPKKWSKENLEKNKQDQGEKYLHLKQESQSLDGYKSANLYFLEKERKEKEKKNLARHLAKVKLRA